MKKLVINKSVTPRNSQSVDSYLRDIAHIPLLTLAEEAYLPQLIKQGDKKALERLVTGNLRFVVTVAKNYINMGLDLSDLISAGNLGLIEAAKRFDPTLGFKFCSYAVWWIRQSILQTISKEGRMVTLPANQQALLSKLRKESIQLEQELGREPTMEELEERLGCTKEQLQRIAAVVQAPLSLDEPINTDEDSTRIDIIEDTASPQTDATLMQESLHIEILDLLASLPTNESAILKMYFGIDQPRPYSLEEIAFQTSLTSERIRQIRNRALERLRQGSQKERLKAYIG